MVPNPQRFYRSHESSLIGVPQGTFPTRDPTENPVAFEMFRVWTLECLSLSIHFHIKKVGNLAAVIQLHTLLVIHDPRVLD